MPLVKTLLDDPNFLEFYVTAKKNTYAIGGDGKAETLRNGGKRYVFYDDARWPQWRYTDIYHGNNPFFGNETVEEIEGTTPSVWTPVARMSYHGFARGNHDQMKRMIAFLKKNLQQVSIQSLFRGPTEDSVLGDGLEYICQWQRTDPFRVAGYEHIRENVLHPMTHWNVLRPMTHWHELSFQFCVLR